MTKSENFIDTSFIGSFKRGDNLKFNSEILCKLYIQNTDELDRIFNKPIIVFALSLVELATYDFIIRIREHTREFAYLDEPTKRAIRKVSKRKLKHFDGDLLSLASRHQLFGHEESFYEMLKELIHLRNRIHIQNIWNNFEPNDLDAFNAKKLNHTELVTEYILKYLSINYPRQQDFVGGLSLPWKAHFDEEFITKRSKLQKNFLHTI